VNSLAFIVVGIADSHSRNIANPSTSNGDEPHGDVDRSLKVGTFAVRNQFTFRCGMPALFALLAILAGCTSVRDYFANGLKVGPNYCPPAAPIADEWIDSGDGRLSSEPAEFGAWWRAFNDPTLERLIQIAREQSITLREAGIRIREAQAERAVVTGEFFPQTQELFGEYTRTQRSTQTATFPRGGGAGGFGTLALSRFDGYRLGGRLAWELDFWGRFRRAIEAADARLDGSIENYDDVFVLLISEVATSYVDVRTVEQRLDFARENVKLQQESARIAEARRNAAVIDSEIDAPQAKSNLARTQSAIEALEIARRQAENRLAVLLGMPPQDLSPLLNGPAPIPVAPDSVAIGIPGELLRRRPDVRRAERLVAAQSAEIGIATADLYPHISVAGSMSLDAAQFQQLFDRHAFAGTVGPSFQWSILNYGRLLNSIRIEDAQFQEQVAIFQQTVLQANEEAENAIVAFLRYHVQLQHLQTSVDHAQEATRVAQAKYRAGQIDFNRLFTVEQLLVGQQDQLATARGNLARSLIQLYKALGGGWEIRLEPEFSAEEPNSQLQ
jgi:NodT family efflux transporter outer membrane factor (OMF) lipoprotein